MNGERGRKRMRGGGREGGRDEVVEVGVGVCTCIGLARQGEKRRDAGPRRSERTKGGRHTANTRPITKKTKQANKE